MKVIIDAEDLSQFQEFCGSFEHPALYVHSECYKEWVGSDVSIRVSMYEEKQLKNYRPAFLDTDQELFFPVYLELGGKVKYPQFLTLRTRMDLDGLHLAVKHIEPW